MFSGRNIDSQKVAEFLSDRSRSRHLDPFLGKQSTVADAAAELGISAQRMHYWTRQLLQLGLIGRVGMAVRGRHHSAVYQSVADSFTMPLELLPTSDVETLLLHFDPIWQRFLSAVAATGRKYSSGWNARYSRVGDRAAFHIVPSSDPQPDMPLSNSWARLQLSRADALQLKSELEALLNSYLARPAAEHQRTYISHVALVEDPES